MLNPHTHCIMCGREYSPADETCRNCGFDPIDDEDQEAAESAWDKEQDK